MATTQTNTSPVKAQINELLPVKQTVGNKSILPVEGAPVVSTDGLFSVAAKPTDGTETPPTKPVDTGLDPVTTQPVTQPTLGTVAPTTTAPATTPTASTPASPIPPPLTTTQAPAPTKTAAEQMQGLFDAQMNAMPKVPEVKPSAVPQTSVPSGYTPGAANPALATKDAPKVNYDPRQEALVANQLEKLMDPNSAVNRKAMAIASQLSAQRGLQSSSIAAEAGTSALIDSARQIAAQDASTYAAMQGQNQQYQQNWNINKDNQTFQSGENVLNRSHESQMFDKNAALQSSLLNTQLSFQANENAAGRTFQAQMADLQHKQQLGLLNVQQQSELIQMEKNAQLTGARDEVLQKYQKELTVLNNDQRWKETLAGIDANFQAQNNQFNQQTRMEYSNAQTQIMNTMMEAIGQAMSNPNMTATQQQAMVDQIRSTYQQQADSLAIVYGAKNQATTPPVNSPSDPGGGSAGRGLFPVTSPAP